jgi:uncharacterized protein YkwD
MIKIILLSISLCFFSLQNEDPVVNRDEARQAFEYLNKVRTDPGEYEKDYPFLSGLSSIHALKWNDTLAKVAEARAMDLAKRNYFSHVDPDGFGVNYHINKAGYHLDPTWITDQKSNYFESLGAGARSGIDAIRQLVIDANTPSLGHRSHLLGLTEWDSSLVDIGIGYVTSASSRYPVYTCVIIAKHKW